MVHEDLNYGMSLITGHSPASQPKLMKHFDLGNFDVPFTVSTVEM
jgi:hypothetical protein